MANPSARTRAGTTSVPSWPRSGRTPPRWAMPVRTLRGPSFGRRSLPWEAAATPTTPPREARGVAAAAEAPRAPLPAPPAAIASPRPITEIGGTGRWSGTAPTGGGSWSVRSIRARASSIAAPPMWWYPAVGRAPPAETMRMPCKSTVRTTAVVEMAGKGRGRPPVRPRRSSTPKVMGATTSLVGTCAMASRRVCYPPRRTNRWSSSSDRTIHRLSVKSVSRCCSRNCRFPPPFWREMPSCRAMPSVGPQVRSSMSDIPARSLRRCTMGSWRTVPSSAVPSVGRCSIKPPWSCSTRCTGTSAARVRPARPIPTSRRT
mmetsp:Transcript_21269/g.61021  ORF Transcript_21269/g.61021 Transcript_21269/m.61021 type:complete len:317 (-) Transcript_21269:3509-4459(-)